MLTLFHAKNSRSTRILNLLEEMGVADRVTIRPVTIVRLDGTGARDPANPHPEGKVPALLHDGVLVTESAAVMVALTTLFPETGMAPAVGTARWGEYLAWMTWYGSVMEPVLVCAAAGVSHPFLTAAIRGVPEVTARLRAALQTGPWLLGEAFSAVDLLMHSPYAWLRDATPDDPLIRDWVARCDARPARARVIAKEAAGLAAA